MTITVESQTRRRNPLVFSFRAVVLTILFIAMCLQIYKLMSDKSELYKKIGAIDLELAHAVVKLNAERGPMGDYAEYGSSIQPLLELDDLVVYKLFFTYNEPHFVSAVVDRGIPNGSSRANSATLNEAAGQDPLELVNPSRKVFNRCRGYPSKEPIFYRTDVTFVVKRVGGNLEVIVGDEKWELLRQTFKATNVPILSQCRFPFSFSRGGPEVEAPVCWHKVWSVETVNGDVLHLDVIRDPRLPLDEKYFEGYGDELFGPPPCVNTALMEIQQALGTHSPEIGDATSR